MNETWVGREANGGVEVRRDTDPVVSEEEGPWLPVVEVLAPLGEGEAYDAPRYRLSDDGGAVEVVYDAVPAVNNPEPTPAPVVPVIDQGDVEAARAQIAGATTIAALRIAMLRFLDVIDPAVPVGAATAVGDSTRNPSGGTNDGSAR